MEAQTPVPLDGLIQTPDTSAFTINEALDGRDLDGDGDFVDAVLTLRDRDTGVRQPLGAPAGCGIAAVPPPEGRAVARIEQPPFSFPAVAAEGPIVAFLESEATTNDPTSKQGNDPATERACQENADGDTFDTVVRVFELGTGELTTGLVPPRAADADPMIDGESLAVSSRRVFFRTAEAAGAEQQTTRVSVDSNESQVNASSGSSLAISSDGRFVAFASDAADLVVGDANGLSDVFVRDRVNGTTVRVSVATGGAEAHGGSTQPSISRDGRYVAFASAAPDLVAGDGNGTLDVFVRDRDADGDGISDEIGQTITTRVSVATSGAEAHGSSSEPSLSADGRFVAFTNAASDLVGGDGNGATDVFRHDRDTDGDGVFDEAGAIATIRVSVGPGGLEGDDASLSPALAADGQHVAFVSFASNLVGPVVDTNLAADVFVRDLATAATARVSVGTGGGQATGDSAAAAISGDGRVVAFVSNAEDLVAGDTNSVPDVFVRDRASATTARVSVSSSGGQASAPFSGSFGPSMSRDGRFVVFLSDASNLVAADSNDDVDVFLHDGLTGATEVVSVGPTGLNASGSSVGAAISGDGRFVVFASTATNLVPGDTNVCGGCTPAGCCGDVFVRGPDPTDLANDRFPDGALDDIVLEVFDTASLQLATLCPAEQVSVANGNAAFLRPEATAGGNAACSAGSLNPPDTDTADRVVQLWRGGTQVLNLGRSATAVSLSASHLAALVTETSDGTDYNGDGDLGDNVVQVRGAGDPAGPASWQNTGQAADVLQVNGSIVAFLTPEAAQGAGGTNLNGAGGTPLDTDVADRVLQIYDATAQATTNVGQAAAEFVVGDARTAPCGSTQLVAFRTAEAAQGGQDLNGDGDSTDDVLQVYDAATGVVYNLRQAVIPCRLEACDPRQPYRVTGNQVRFLTLECAQGGSVTAGCPAGGKDLNGDGDAADLVIQVFDFCTKAVTVLGAVDAAASDGNPLAEVEDSTAFLSPAGRCTFFCARDDATCGGGAACAPDTCDAPTGKCATSPGVNCTTDTQCPRRCALIQPPTCGDDLDCPLGAACQAELVVAASVVADDDGDGVPNEQDDCPSIFDDAQSDRDGDGVGDACDTQSCGNGTREADEQCDDGNLVSGDGCSATCRLACEPVPLAGCAAPIAAGKATLAIKNATPDKKDQLVWSWSKGPVTPLADFGDPLHTESYTLCLYDATGLVAAATAPAGDTCGGGKKPKPCWKAGAKGFTYKDKEQTPDGLVALTLTSGTKAGQAKITVKGQGARLTLPNLAALSSPVTVQLVNTGGKCWQAVYSAPFAKQTATEFKAKGE